jgi:hypothetical protein
LPQTPKGAFKNPPSSILPPKGDMYNMQLPSNYPINQYPKYETNEPSVYEKNSYFQWFPNSGFRYTTVC